MTNLRAVAADLWREVSLAVRGLLRHKGFALIACTTVAIGVGASAAVFTLVDTVVLRALPYRDPARLVKVFDTQPSLPLDDVSWADFVDLTAQQDVFETLGADDGRDFRIRVDDGPLEAVGGAMVTAAWLETLGVRPMLGRGLLAADFAPEGGQVALLAHSFWVRRFGSEPAAVGRTVVVDDERLTIVGVLPPNVLRFGADVIRPLVAARYPQARSHRDLDVVARLKPGVGIARAQSALDIIAGRLASDYPATNARHGFRVEPLGHYYVALEPDAARGLVLLLGAAGLVLLIACTNVTTLMLTRAMLQSRECLVRTALGASRARLVRQLMVEAAVLFLAGGALGVAVARWSLDGLVAVAVSARYVPERLSVAVDARVLAISLAICLATALLSGLAPALQASRIDLSVALRATGPTTSRGAGRRWSKRLLIVAELAMTLVLLIGAGLLVRSLLHLQSRPTGIDPANLLLTASDGGRDFTTAVAYWRRALERAEALPGVRAAAVASRPPVHGARGYRFRIEGQAAEAPGPRAGDILISAGYFAAAGVPLLQGRPFTARDGAGTAPVVIVSQSFARRHFPGGSPLGRRISLSEERLSMACCSTAGPVEGVWREIVGVVADVRQESLEDEPAMTMYRPFTQIVQHDMFLLVRARSAHDAATLVTRLPSDLAAVDPARVWSDVGFMQDSIDGSAAVRGRRFVLTLLGWFGGLAVLLAAVGMFAVMANVVAERTREIGIRVALGARRADVLVHVYGEAVMLAGAAVVVGALGAYLASRSIASLLYGISATDAVTHAGAALVLVVVTLVATAIPAHRAASVDPLVALRQD